MSLLIKSNQTNWFVILTSANAEQKVYNRIIDKGYKAFLPTYECISIWSDRKKKINKPLISCTLFVKCTQKELYDLYTVPGVSGVLRYLGQPAVVQEWEIENLRIVLKEFKGQPIEEAFEHIMPGENIRVVRGPFKGLYGTSLECEGRHRVLITIDSIGAAFTINVPRSYVKTVNEQQIA